MGTTHSEYCSPSTNPAVELVLDRKNGNHNLNVEFYIPPVSSNSEAEGLSNPNNTKIPSTQQLARKKDYRIHCHGTRSLFDHEQFINPIRCSAFDSENVPIQRGDPRYRHLETNMRIAYDMTHNAEREFRRLEKNEISGQGLLLGVVFIIPLLYTAARQYLPSQEFIVDGDPL